MFTINFEQMLMLLSMLVLFVIAFLVFSSYITEQFNHYYINMPDELKAKFQPRKRGRLFDNTPTPVSTRGGFLKTIISLIVICFLVFGCGKKKDTCWSCVNWGGTDFEMCDKSEAEVREMERLTLCNCVQK